jgi:hypothetical protein
VFRFRVGLGRYPSLFVLVRGICGINEGLASSMMCGSGRTAFEAGPGDVHHIPAGELTTAAFTAAA